MIERKKSQGSCNAANCRPQNFIRGSLRIKRSDAGEICREPMFELLAASTIYFLLGKLGEALILAGSALTTIVVAIIQENRTERVLKALPDLASSTRVG
jgi:P-type Ca2+ transporter type 2C